MQSSTDWSFANVAMELQVVKKQLQPKEAPQRRLFSPAQLPAVAATWLQGLCVLVQQHKRGCEFTLSQSWLRVQEP